MDKDIINDILTANKESFSVIIDEYQKMIYNLCYRMFNNKNDAEDMVQETFIRAYKNLYKCRGKDSIKTWIYTLAYNICIDEIRKRGSKKNMQKAEDDMLIKGDAMNSMCSYSPEKLFLDKEGLMHIERAINSLEGINRAIIFLRDIKGLTYMEISDITGLNIGTVKSRINRAHKLLRQALEL